MTNTSGTKEWADSNVNIFHGCSNDCVYCYAKKMAIRFGRRTKENWKFMELNEKAFDKNYGKRKGRIMFPTSHDITFGTLVFNILALQKMLMAGNEVLITTKPDPKCILGICYDLKPWKEQIQFRFTITSKDNIILKKYEPNAPLYEDRMVSLQLAFYKGFKTSVSIEPFLDKDPIPLINKRAPYVTETIWIGKLNYQKTEFNTKENVEKVIRSLEKLPENIKSKIRLKDSIRNDKNKQNLDNISLPTAHAKPGGTDQK